MSMYVVAIVLILISYQAGVRLTKWWANIAITALLVVPWFFVTAPFWRALGHLSGGDAGMAVGFLFLSIFPYSMFGALVLIAFLFGKSNKIDMIS